MNAAAEFYALQPGEDEDRTFDPAELAQGNGQAVLTRVTTQLSEHERGRHRALLDESGEAKDFIPMSPDSFEVERSADHRFQRVIGGLSLWNIQLCIAQVSDAGSEVEAQQTAAQFLRWDHAGAIVLPGLLARRRPRCRCFNRMTSTLFDLLLSQPLASPFCSASRLRDAQVQSGIDELIALPSFAVNRQHIIHVRMHRVPCRH